MKKPKPANDEVLWLVEMIRRANEMRAMDRPPGRAKLKQPAVRYTTDLDLFEAAMDGLGRSDLHPEKGFAPEAIPGFAALLSRVIEQTAAEFGNLGCRTALRFMADALEDSE